ncbi:MAG: hypothetical protein LUC50_07540 [Ruminococcus sp.]|nr:hypothetical protein [Ruminococcus sp.]
MSFFSKNSRSKSERGESTKTELHRRCAEPPQSRARSPGRRRQNKAKQIELRKKRKKYKVQNAKTKQKDLTSKEKRKSTKIPKSTQTNVLRTQGEQRTK